MLRGYRGIVAAIAGLILVGAGQPPQQSADPKQNTAQAQENHTPLVASAPPSKSANPVQRPKQDQPCGQSRYASNDDLCAQWKAADAASEAAKWAWWQIVLSALGVLGLGITLWFNFRALRLAEREASETKDALAIAETTATAAVRLADLAETTANKQLRAYVYVKSVSLEQVFDAQGPSTSVILTINNSGQTPAYNQMIIISVSWVYEGGHTLMFEIDNSARFRVHKDVPVIIPFQIAKGFDKSDMPGWLMVFGRIEYKDAFGKLYKEPFTWRTLAHDFLPFDEITLPTKLAYFAIESIVNKSVGPRAPKKRSHRKPKS